MGSSSDRGCPRVFDPRTLSFDDQQTDIFVEGLFTDRDCGVDRSLRIAEQVVDWTRKPSSKGKGESRRAILRETIRRLVR